MNITPSGGMWWRKTSDVNREYFEFELIFGEEIVLIIGYSDTGSFEV